MDLPGGVENSPLLERSQNSRATTSVNGLSSPRRGRHFWSRLLAHPSAHLMPLRVFAFAALAVLFGAIVLIKTNNLSPTEGIPASVLISGPSSTAATLPLPLRADASNCSVHWIDQKIDHFAWLAGADNATSQAATYKQRYLVNDQFWDPTNKNAPVFFYTGNEGDVTLYANNTGLMWENAKDFNALLVFAEHRYYGESLPFGSAFMDHLEYLNHEQALADYLELIYFLQRKYKAGNHAVILFGGSYGGMLAAWFRMKYPAVAHGAIAASAPILGFPAFPEWKGENYWSVVTQDASPAKGAAANCVPNVKKSWTKLFALAKTEQGRKKLTQIFKLCEPLTKESEGEALAMAVLVAFDTLAMGNFPYPSSYLTNGAAELPSWPVREACSHLKADFAGDDVGDDALLAALRDAAYVFHNATQDLPCYKLPSLTDFDGIWDWQWCTEMLPQETYFTTNGVTDMFWPRNVTMRAIREHCESTWHVTPDPDWIRVSYGDATLRYASNIVFSNGKLDPWSSGGVQSVPKDSKLRVVWIEEGAHHIDLFFSHADDTPSIKAARKLELEQIRIWIDEFVATLPK